MWSKLFSNLSADGSPQPEVPGIVEETWLVQNDEASHGGDGNKLKPSRWLSSFGRIDESSVALQGKLERVAMS